MTEAATPEPNETPPSGGRFAHNVAQLARAPRAAGLPVGPGHVLQVLRDRGHLMGKKPELRFRIIQKNATLVAELDV